MSRELLGPSVPCVKYLIIVLFTSYCVNVVRANENLVGLSCTGFVHGTKYVNAENCRTYVICNAGLFELEYCPSGFYNPQKNDCDLDYKCILDNLPEVTTRFEVTSRQEDTESSTTVSLDTTTPQYTSTALDKTTQTSTFAVPTSTSLNPEVTVTPSPATTTSFSETTTEIPIDPHGCPSTDTDEPTYINDKHDCEKYYLCYHTKAVEMRCITGMYWNADTRKCDFAQNVKCPVDGNGDANSLPKCTSAGRYSMPHPQRCEYFIMCVDGEQTIQQCDAFHRWDVLSQKCLIKDTATCILDITGPERTNFWANQDFLYSNV